MFIGDGIQREAIECFEDIIIIPFMMHFELVEYFRLADIGVWPRQESISMLDAAVSGLPIIGSNKIGVFKRIHRNGSTYEEDDLESLANVIRLLSLSDVRGVLSITGRKK